MASSPSPRKWAATSSITCPGRRCATSSPTPIPFISSTARPRSSTASTTPRWTRSCTSARATTYSSSPARCAIWARSMPSTCCATCTSPSASAPALSSASAPPPRASWWRMAAWPASTCPARTASACWNAPATWWPPPAAAARRGFRRWPERTTSRRTTTKWTSACASRCPIR